MSLHQTGLQRELLTLNLNQCSNTGETIPIPGGEEDNSDRQLTQGPNQNCKAHPGSSDELVTKYFSPYEN